MSVILDSIVFMISERLPENKFTHSKGFHGDQMQSCEGEHVVLIVSAVKKEGAGLGVEQREAH